MPDFVPDDMEEYIERSKRIDKLINVTDDETVEGGTLQLAEWTMFVANAMVETGNLERLEAVAATTSIVSGVLAAWYAGECEPDE
jgi:uncharacterized alpha-E superfamily protein